MKISDGCSEEVVLQMRSLRKPTNNFFGPNDFTEGLGPDYEDKKKKDKEEITYREVLMEFMEHTTAHGFCHIFRSIQFKDRVLTYVVIALTLSACVGASLIFVRTTIAVFFSDVPLKSSIRIDMPTNGMRLPKIIICNSGLFNITAADEIGLDQELRAYFLVTLGNIYITHDSFKKNVTRQQELENRFTSFLEDYGKGIKSLIFDVSYRCENVIIYCIFGTMMDGPTCCKTYFKTVTTYYGLCYENSKDEMPYQKLEGELNGLYIFFRITEEMETLDWAPDIILNEMFLNVGFLVAVMNNITSSSQAAITGTIPIRRGTANSIAVEYLQVDNSRLMSNLGPLAKPVCIPLDASEEELGMTRGNCLITKIKKTGECFSLIFSDLDELSNGTLRRCSSSEMFAAYSTDDEEYINYLYDFTSCKLACIEERYTTKSTVTNLKLQDEKNYTAVMNLHYPNFMSMKVEQTKPNFCDWISDLGGQMGILLGASIITILEMMTFTIYSVLLILRWMWRTIFGKQDG